MATSSSNVGKNILKIMSDRQKQIDDAEAAKISEDIKKWVVNRIMTLEKEVASMQRGRVISIMRVMHERLSEVEMNMIRAFSEAIGVNIMNKAFISNDSYDSREDDNWQVKIRFEDLMSLLDDANK